MKIFRLFVIICCLFVSRNLFAQTPKAIEEDLLKSFKKIDDWSNDTSISANESLWKAKKTVGEKLYYYTNTFPVTITYQFDLLKKEHVNISTSDDGLFRIYSWDTWTGGTSHFFENVFQYKYGGGTKAILDTVKQEGDIRPYYSNLYTLKTGNKTYYLGIYNGVYSTKDAGTGIQVFAIENGKLNDDVKIIKTTSGLHSEIYYDYDFFSVVDIPYGKRPTIYFDKATQTIHVPVVVDKGKVTNKYINYKFTGQYFEKVN